VDDKEITNKLVKGNSLRAIVNNPEWPVIEEIFKKEYMSALSDLIDKENEVARSTIKAIDILYAKITNGLRMADIASKELSKKIK
jgi:hypothetical protein